MALQLTKPTCSSQYPPHSPDAVRHAFLISQPNCTTVHARVQLYGLDSRVCAQEDSRGSLSISQLDRFPYSTTSRVSMDASTPQACGPRKPVRKPARKPASKHARKLTAIHTGSTLRAMSRTGSTPLGAGQSLRPSGRVERYRAVLSAAPMRHHPR